MAEVLVVGGGGREQAIAQAMEASVQVSRVVVNPNAQTGLQEFSGGTNKPFVVIGPEAPLVAGLADELRNEGYTVFGASADAAQYEASKTRATKMANAAKILHPRTFIAEGRWLEDDSRAYVHRNHPRTYVIKADGLAGGKGVVLPETRDEALEVVEGMLDGSMFDGAGTKAINFQRRHEGPEVSALVVVGDGHDDFVVLPLSQDHKRLGNGDTGPNTGGMGAYASVPDSIVSFQQREKIYEKARASLLGMKAEGVDYRQSVLYMGLMMAKDLELDSFYNEYAVQDDSLLIEYNVRFGDPEAQAVFPLLQHAGVDVYQLLHSAATGRIETDPVDYANIGCSALSVCLAAANYPGSPIKGDVITGLDRSYENVTVQLAGIAESNEQVVTNGGRVLYVTGVGETIDQAAQYAYKAIGHDAINFAGMQFRDDIGWQARDVS